MAGYAPLTPGRDARGAMGAMHGPSRDEVSMEIQAIIQELCTKVPAAIGAIVCDFEGEAVVCARGRAAAPVEAAARAREHVPRAIELTMPIEEFLMRLAGAEPCGLIRMFEASGLRRGLGALATLEIRYSNVEMLVHKLPNDFYLMLLLRRPAVTAEARRFVSEASDRLRAHVS